MNTQWKEFLEKTGASHTEDAGFAFCKENEAHLAAQNDTIICDLSSYSLIVVAGDDAVSFMQGQFTNDVTQVDDSHCQLSALCNNKGRMLANFRLFKNQANYFISLKNNLSESVVDHLQKYILRATVAVQDISEQLVHLGISGDSATELLGRFIDNIDASIDSVSSNDDYIAIRVAGEKPRYQIFCSAEKAQALWQQLADDVKAVNTSAWDYLDILAGLPFIDSGTSGAFVPQMANMDLINGISFTKGCYTGQEIVARMHYLGKLKKRCFRVHIETDTKPLNGETLFAEDARAGQNTGAIIMSAASPEGGYEALAVIQLADAESRLHLHNAEGPLVTVGELPYGLEVEEST